MNKWRLFRTGVCGLLVSLIIIFLYGYYIPSAPVFGKVYYQSISSDRVVALTFDDGPNEPYTSMLLDVLARYNAKATFFLIGNNVETYPEVARRILDEEHDIGNHSYTHNANHALTFISGTRDVMRAQGAIFEAVGVYPHLYRPPHGKTTPWQLSDIRQAGMFTVTWNVTTSELGGHSPEIMAQDIINKVRPGCIILLHDGYGTSIGSVRADKSATVDAVDLIVRKLLEMDYSFLTVSELLDTSPYLDF